MAHDDRGTRHTTTRHPLIRTLIGVAPVLLLCALHLSFKLFVLQEFGLASADSLEGSPCPDFELPTVGGPTATTLRFDPDDHEFDYQVLTFWASWCAPCQVELRHLAASEPLFHEANVRIMTVSVDHDLDDASRFLAQNHLMLPAAWDTDGSVANAFQVTTIPVTFLVRDGTIAGRFDGLIRLSPEALRRFLVSRAPTSKGKHEK